MLFGLTKQGFRPKQLEHVLFELGFAHKANFGPGVNLDPETSVAGRLIGIYGERETLLWELAKDVHDASRPSSAEGLPLDDIGEITNLERLQETSSTVVVKCLGTVGTVIPQGRVMSVNGSGDRFSSDADATIGVSGFVEVPFTAQEPGAVQAPAGSLTIIETPVVGWTSAVNEADAIVGRDVETDTEYRKRREESLQATGAGTVDAIRARILNEVANVTDVIVYENDTDFVDLDGRPPHSKQVIVAGGADVDIAEKIWDVKAGGIPEYGTDVIVSVVDSMGFPHDVKFDRADVRRVFVHVRLSVGTGFIVGTKQKMRVEVGSNSPGDTLTVTINGREFVAVAGASDIATAAAIVAAIETVGADWVPATATEDGPPSKYFFLESDFEGNPFILDLASSGSTTLTATTVTQNSGDQTGIIEDIVAFAEGTGDFPREQTIGADFFRSRYFTPVNQTPYVQGIELFTANGLDGADYWPVEAPPAGLGWSASDVVVGPAEFGDVESVRVTVEIV